MIGRNVCAHSVNEGLESGQGRQSPTLFCSLNFATRQTLE
jgi:hypothetical protein